MTSVAKDAQNQTELAMNDEIEVARIYRIPPDYSSQNPNVFFCNFV
jgi:hypothetical protein